MQSKGHYSTWPTISQSWPFNPKPVHSSLSILYGNEAMLIKPNFLGIVWDFLGNQTQNKERMVIPTWLESLLSTPFFYVCPLHKDAPRSECNMFCLDCHHHSFCFYCRSDLHHDHHVIQVGFPYHNRTWSSISQCGYQFLASWICNSCRFGDRRTMMW